VAEAELTGVAIVGAGSFNPAIFHPRWFAENTLLAANEAEHALQEIVLTPQLTSFHADWLSVQVTLEQAIFSTVDAGRAADLRDLAHSVFTLLPHTPINGLGINADSHYRLENEEAWHEIGDLFLPKERWEPLFEGHDWAERHDGRHVGLRTMTVEVWRTDRRSFVRVEVAPSVRVTPNGVYIGINGHFQLRVDDVPGTGLQAANLLGEHWEETRSLEAHLQERLIEWAR
jgi:hypothetical protein